MGSVAVAWTALIVVTLLCVAAMGAGRRIVAESESYDAHGLADQVNRIIEIESSGDPTRIGKAGEMGLMQIRRDAWEEACKYLEADWPFEDAGDPVRNIIVGSVYYDVLIPRYLKAHGLPDSPYMRLAAYNWGIGHLSLYCRFREPDQWFDQLPSGVKRYCLKWRDAKPQANYVHIYLKGLHYATCKEGSSRLHRPGR